MGIRERLANAPRPAVLTFGTYVLLSGLIGELFPFSTYPMYADVNDRPEAAVPLAQVDGELVHIAKLACLDEGLQPMNRANRPVSMPPMPGEDPDFLAKHAGPGATHTAAFGYLWLKRNAEGGYDRSFEVEYTTGACFQ